MGRRHLVLAAFLLTSALAGRLALALALPNDEPDDGRMYALMAHDILAGGVYSNDDAPPYAPTYVRVPGYPLFVALVYRLFGDANNTALRVVQALMDTATCGAIGLLARLWSPRDWDEKRRRRAGIWGLALAACCPFQAVYVTTILTETLATALGTAVLLGATVALEADEGTDQPPPSRLWSSALWWITGLTAGAMTMVRPESGLYAAAVGLTLVAVRAGAWFRARTARSVSATIRPAAVLSLGFVVALAPWTARNAALFGVFEPLNPRSLSMPGEFVAEGYAAWMRSWIDHPRYVGPLLFNLDREPITIEQVPQRAFDSEAERREVASLFREYSTPAPDAEPDASGLVPPGGMTPEIDRRFGAIAASRARQHPLRQYVVLPLKRAVMLWFDPHADYYPFAGFLFPWSDLDADRQQQFWLPLFLLLTLAWTALAAAGAARLLGRRGARRWVLLVALIVIPRLLLLSAMENPEPRYTMEFFPLLTVLAACAIAGLGARDAAGAAAVV